MVVDDRGGFRTEGIFSNTHRRRIFMVACILIFLFFFAKLPFIGFHISFLLYVSSRSLTRGFIVCHAIRNLSLVYFHLINSTMVHTHVLAI